MTILEVYDILAQSYPDFEWTTPPNADHGIYTTNAAFKQAKEKKMNPVECAVSLSKEIQLALQNYPLTVTTVGPYINIQLQDGYWVNMLSSQKRSWGYTQAKEKKTVLLDFFAPNVGKKMHVGHIRSGNLGESLRRILSLKYQTVVSNNHLGDWGIQFGYLIWGILNIDKLSIDVTFDITEPDPKKISDQFYTIYVQVNKLLEANEDIKKEAAAITRDLEESIIHHTTSQYFELFSSIISRSIEYYRYAEQRLQLNKGNAKYTLPDAVAAHNKSTGNTDVFSMILGESTYIQFLSEISELQNSWIQREGKAVYVDLEKEKLGRCYLISSEGYSLYHTRDIIARLFWRKYVRADIMLSLADTRQTHSFKQVFAMLDKLASDTNVTYTSELVSDELIQDVSRCICQHIGFGFMTLPDGAMSTRKGKIVSFEELDETLKQKTREVLETKGQQTVTAELVNTISLAALKWVDLHRDREQDVVFDIQQFIKNEGNTGVYQLYTVARLHSILQNNAEVSTNVPEWNSLNTTEQGIFKKLYQLPRIIESVTASYKPHALCTYLFELATEVNSWYAKYSVQNEPDVTRKATLLYFVTEVKDCMEYGLDLLGISTVESL